MNTSFPRAAAMLLGLTFAFAACGDNWPAPPYCGNGQLDPGERCDDGNDVAGDGCSSVCTIEPGYECFGSPSVCGPRCGDGIIIGDEQCDDLNTENGDGCSSTCQIEEGWICSGQPSECEPGETVCGDGIISGGETCDDGNTQGGDGCSSTCQIEEGWICSGQPSECEEVTEEVCGDGVISGNEECDDGNTEGGDGCSATCQIEEGWTCTGQPSECEEVTEEVCGDGVISGNEECDDGNTEDGDGCSSTCQIEEGWTCTGEPSECELIDNVFFEEEPNDTIGDANGPYPVDSRVIGGISPTGSDVDVFAFVLTAYTDLVVETFDDEGNGGCASIDTVVEFLAEGGALLAMDDDGGVARCGALDPARDPEMRGLAPGIYYVRVSAYGGYRDIPGYELVVRPVAVCGDGVVEGSEQCDGGGACSEACRRVPTCGDGFVDGDEECDDGNTTSGDGCSASCTWEAFLEDEPNDVPAQASGPFLPPVLLEGAISPIGDTDLYAIDLVATSDLRAETFDAYGPGSCDGIDTVLTLLDAGGNELLRRDQNGIGDCSLIDPQRDIDAAARRLLPGRYYLRVEDYLNDGIIPGYRLLVTLSAVCGDGIVEGSEQCDGGAGCQETCERVPVCGDGYVDGDEECDDGNTASGDGCSATCALEDVPEVEPNNDASQASGPAAPFMLWSGAITPVGDADWYAVTLDAYSDLTAETFGAELGACGPVDTVLVLFGPDGVTGLASDSNSGIGTCSRIDSRHAPGARRLAPGTYYLRVVNNNTGSIIPRYLLSVRLDAVCGDGVVEGSEQCDGGDGCQETCERVPVCGDGWVDGNEQCDDGNTEDGDGCSATCQLETIPELEPNDSIAEAMSSTFELSGSALVSGTFSEVGDQDFFRLVLAENAVVRAETFDITGDCAGVSTTLRLYDPDPVNLRLSDDNSGIRTCSAFVMSLAAGTYVIEVEDRGNDFVPGYLLQVSVQQPGGVEVESNDTRDTATPFTGSDVYVVGSHLDPYDKDWWVFEVPDGASLRAEVIEGGSETCESRNIDAYITLVDANGVELGFDDDGGRGYCARIDGTGEVPAHAWASNLPGGLYYLRVEASPWAVSVGSAAASFDYRLAVTLR